MAAPQTRRVYALDDLHGADDDLSTLSLRQRRLQDLSDKLVTVGEAGVGKTSLIKRFFAGTFTEDCKATIGVEFYAQRFTFKGFSYTLNCWDTAGQERFRSISAAYFRGSSACIIAFDLAVPATLAKAAQADMYHAVPKAEALRVAKELNAEYFEVSAKSDDGVQALFSRIAYILVRKKISSALEEKRSHSLSPKGLAPSARHFGGGSGVGNPARGKGTENWKGSKSVSLSSGSKEKPPANWMKCA